MHASPRVHLPRIKSLHASALGFIPPGATVLLLSCKKMQFAPRLHRPRRKSLQTSRGPLPLPIPSPLTIGFPSCAYMQLAPRRHRPYPYITSRRTDIQKLWIRRRKGIITPHSQRRPTLRKSLQTSRRPGGILGALIVMPPTCENIHLSPRRQRPRRKSLHTSRLRPLFIFPIIPGAPPYCC